MKKFRIYLETTMFNYYFDTERDSHADTVRMFEAMGFRRFVGIWYSIRSITGSGLHLFGPAHYGFAHNPAPYRGLEFRQVKIVTALTARLSYLLVAAI